MSFQCVRLKKVVQIQENTDSYPLSNMLWYGNVADLQLYSYLS